jgi:hypothetical protein
MSKCCDGIAILGCSLLEMLAKIRGHMKSTMNLLNCWSKSTTLLDADESVQNSSASVQNVNETITINVVDHSTEIPTIPAELELPTDPKERRRIKDREYHKRYAEKKRRQKEAAKARQIILDFKKRKETSTADELSDWFLSVGTYVANTLLEMIGQEQFDQFTAQYKGVSRLEIIPAMIELLVECIVSQ